MFSVKIESFFAVDILRVWNDFSNLSWPRSWRNRVNFFDVLVCTFFLRVSCKCKFFYRWCSLSDRAQLYVLFLYDEWNCITKDNRLLNLTLAFFSRRSALLSHPSQVFSLFPGDLDENSESRYYSNRMGMQHGIFRQMGTWRSAV